MKGTYLDKVSDLVKVSSWESTPLPKSRDFEVLTFYVMLPQ